MGDDDGCRYVGIDVTLGGVMVARRSFRSLFTLILIDLVVSFSYILRITFFFIGKVLSSLFIHGFLGTVFHVIITICRTVFNVLRII